MQITGAIITKNEESNIEECIQSMLPVCDEIVVLDSGSTDKTLEIARSLGAQVFSEEWKGFEHGKNRLNQLSSHPYVLNLDADERLSKALQQSIHKAKPMLEGAYYMNRLNNYCGTWIHHSGWYPDQKTRLFPKETIWKGGALHEFPDVSKYPLQKLDGDLLHFTYKTMEAHYATIEKYAQLGAEKLQSKSKFTLTLKHLFSPAFKFFKMYILKRGFLDGKAGYLLCKTSAKGQKLKYSLAVKMKDLKN